MARILQRGQRFSDYNKITMITKRLMIIYDGQEVVIRLWMGEAGVVVQSLQQAGHQPAFRSLQPTNQFVLKSIKKSLKLKQTTARFQVVDHPTQPTNQSTS